MTAPARFDTTTRLSITPLERNRVVGLCSRLTGDPHIAEDLAQETLLIAWSHAASLRDPGKRLQWLFGIARNVSMNWIRTSRREQAEFTNPIWVSSKAVPESDDGAAEDAEPGAELEQQDLTALLDRAMKLLPPETKDLLVQRYIQEFSHSEISDRLGLSDGAVRLRLHRGRIALRRVLEDEFSEEIGIYGVTLTDRGNWQDTRIWCPICGQQTWKMRFDSNTISFRCPACAPDPSVPLTAFRRTNSSFSELINGLVQPRAIVNRTAAWSNDYFRRALRERRAPCSNCGRVASVLLSIHDDTSMLLREPNVVRVVCDMCGEVTNSSFAGLLMNLPDVQKFWRSHRRIRKLANREIEVDGQAAIRTRLESVGHTAYLDVVFRRDNLDILGAYSDRGSA